MSEFQGILQDELTRRVKRNARYSLRAFARDLAISPSRLSEIMNGSGAAGLSRNSVRTACQRLGLSGERTEYLCDTVDAAHSRSELRRKLAADRLIRGKREPDVYEFKDDAFRSIAEWYHLAVLALVETQNFQAEPEWVARTLGIPAETALEALDRLERLGLLELDDDGAVKLVKTRSRVADGVAPQAMRQYHQQILGKAVTAMNEQSRDERMLFSVMYPMAPEAYPELLDALNEFKKKAREITDKYGPKTQVYAVAAQVFKVAET